MSLTREQLLAHAGQLPVEEVDVPEFDGKVRVQGMSGTDRDAFEASLVVLRRKKDGSVEEGRDFGNLRSKLIVRCLVDENGKRMFHDGEYDVLGQLPAVALDKLWEAATRLSGMGDDDVAELIEDFGGTRDESFTTPSPSPSGAPSPNS